MYVKKKEVITLSHFKTYIQLPKQDSINEDRYRYTEIEEYRGSRNTLLHICYTDFQREVENLLNKWCWDNWISMWKKPDH